MVPNCLYLVWPKEGGKKSFKLQIVPEMSDFFTDQTGLSELALDFYLNDSWGPLHAWNTYKWWKQLNVYIFYKI